MKTMAFISLVWLGIIPHVHCSQPAEKIMLRQFQTHYCIAGAIILTGITIVGYTYYYHIKQAIPLQDLRDAVQQISSQQENARQERAIVSALAPLQVQLQRIELGHALFVDSASRDIRTCEEVLEQNQQNIEDITKKLEVMKERVDHNQSILDDIATNLQEIRQSKAEQGMCPPAYQPRQQHQKMDNNKKPFLSFSRR